MLRAEVEDLIQQYDPRADGVPDDEASTDATAAHRAAKDRTPKMGQMSSARNDGSARSRSSKRARWIAQHNPAPTGPLYAVGRPGGGDQNRMGPVLATSGEELLDKLRALLSAADMP